MSEHVTLELRLEFDDDVDESEADTLTQKLRSAILENEVISVSKAQSGKQLPDGAKAGELFSIGALIATTAPATIAGVLLTIRTWIKTRPVRKVQIQIGKDYIEIDDASRAEQAAAIKLFAQRHGETS